MSCRRLLLPLGGAFISGLLLSGCPRLVCDREPALSADGRYRVTVLEVYDQQTTFEYAEGLAPQQGGVSPCPANLRPSAGTTLDLQAMGEDQLPRRCALVRSDLVAASADVAVVGPSTNATASNSAQNIRPEDAATVIIAVDDVTIGGCTGTVGLSVTSGGSAGGFFSVPMSGQRPPAVLYWFFRSSGTSCTSCQSNLAVQMQKLP